MAAQDVVRTTAAAPLAYKLRVRYGECDPQGVVFNANYLAYFDIGIVELFRAAFGSYQAMVDRGVEFVIAVTRLGATSITTSYRVLRDGELLVEGTLRHVLVDLKRLVDREPDAKTAIPDWMREGLGPFRLAPF